MKECLSVMDLHKLLGKLIKKKKGDYPVMLQIVEQGITYAERITGCELGDKADGKLVWIWTDQNLLPPKWYFKVDHKNEQDIGSASALARSLRK